MKQNESQNEKYNGYNRRIVVEDIKWTTRETLLVEDFLIDYCACPEHQYDESCINIGCAKYKSELYRQLDLVKAAKVVITHLSKRKDKVFFYLLSLYIDEYNGYEEVVMDAKRKLDDLYRSVNDISYHEVCDMKLL